MPGVQFASQPGGQAAGCHETDACPAVVVSPVKTRTCCLALSALLAAVVFPGGLPGKEPSVLILPDANSRETYFTIHNLRAAHQIARDNDFADSSNACQAAWRVSPAGA